jgi:hypothetical protein
VARLVRNLLPTGFLYGSPKPDFAQTVPTHFSEIYLPGYKWWKGIFIGGEMTDDLFIKNGKTDDGIILFLQK